MSFGNGQEFILVEGYEGNVFALRVPPGADGSALKDQAEEMGLTQVGTVYGMALEELAPMAREVDRRWIASLNDDAFVSHVSRVPDHKLAELASYPGMSKARQQIIAEQHEQNVCDLA